MSALPCPADSSRAMALLLLATGSACTRVPPGRTAVVAVDVVGNAQVDEDEILERVATVPSPKFLKIWPGVVYDYQLYDPFALERDLYRVERFYRARGYYQAHARVARVIPTTSQRVRVVIVVEEGSPVRVRSMIIRGLSSVPGSVVAAARSAARDRLKENELFDEEAYEAAEDALRRTLTDRGYVYAKVKRDAFVEMPKGTAEVTYDATPGRFSWLGPITIVGLGSLPEAPVRRALDLAEGQRYSTAALDDAREAVLGLGVFSSVDIDPVLKDPPAQEGVVPVMVRVEPTALHSVRLGFGSELDMIKTDVHAVARWEAKNFLGGMRSLAVRDKPGLVLWPTRIPELQPPTELMPENRLRGDFRQPGFVEARTVGLLRAEYNVYPLLLGTRQESSSSVVGYHEVVGSVGVERTVWRVTATPSYNVQADFPFAYVGTRPQIGNVVVSYVDLLTQLDLRDDAVHPRKGVLAIFDAQAAGGILGGTARDVRVQPDLRGYIPITRRVTLAARGSVGFLFPEGYGETYGRYAQNGFAPPSAFADWTRDLQILFFRGFYAGGTSSNRGYPLRGVGPLGSVPLFNPEIAARQVAQECNPNIPEEYTSPRCLYPLSGLSLWEASLELRFPISGPITGATFCDASDVSPRRTDIRLGRPHLSCGIGARYETPVGPIRLDIGYRVPGAQTIDASRDEARDEAHAPVLFGFFPGAVAVGIGEAF